MREYILLPFRFLFILVLVFAVFVFLDLTAAYPHTIESSVAMPGFFLSLPTVVIREFFPSLVTGIALVFMSLLNRKINRFVALLVVFALSAAVFVFGYRLMATISAADAASGAPRAETATFANLDATDYQYITSREGDTARGIHLVRLESVPVLSYYPLALEDAQGGGLEWPEGHPIFEAPGTTPDPAVQNPEPSFMASLAEEMRMILARFDGFSARDDLVSFLLFGGILIFAFCSLSVLLRISSWPVFNFFLYCAALRLFFAVFRLFAPENWAGMAAGDQGGFLYNLSFYSLGLLAVFLLLWDAIFLSPSRKKAKQA